MDPRGATPFLDNPTGAWEHLADQAGVALPNLIAARDYTRERIHALRGQLADESIAAGLSICVFGSWAREELTPDSDDDWAVVSAEPFNAYDSTVVSAVAIAQRHLGAEDRAPGSQKIFGVYEFPAEHWRHIRTSNAIESSFATVKLRTRVTKGAGSKKAALAMAYKLLDAAQERWRRFNGHELITDVLDGTKFNDGIKVTDDETTTTDEKVAA